MRGWEWHRSRVLGQMFESHIRGELDTWTDKQVRHTLFRMRARAAIEPWIMPVRRLARFLWEQTYGRYRRSRSKNNRGSNQASSVGAGATFVYTSPNAPVAFTGFATLGPVNTARPAVDDAGVRAGEIVAYRCWRLQKHDGLLYSVSYGDHCWLPGQPMEGEPDADNHAGVHAFKDRIAVGSFGYDPRDRSIVSGTVELWGTVIEHERGYRAQFAAIRSIDDSPFYDAKAIRKRYGLTKRRKRLDKSPKPE